MASKNPEKPAKTGQNRTCCAAVREPALARIYKVSGSSRIEWQDSLDGSRGRARCRAATGSQISFDSEPATDVAGFSMAKWATRADVGGVSGIRAAVMVLSR